MGYGDCEARREALRAEHGTPRSLPDRAGVLRMLGVRHLVHPADVLVFAYRDRAAAEAYAQANRDGHGIGSLGITVTEGGGAVGVLDLRAAIANDAWCPADPAWPDSWRYGQPEPLTAG